MAKKQRWKFVNNNDGLLQMKKLLFAAAIMCMGCLPESHYVPPSYDQCLRAKLFNECLQHVPQGPTHTVASNDWDEVIEVCGREATWQSERPKDQIKPECRAQ